MRDRVQAFERDLASSLKNVYKDSQHTIKTVERLPEDQVGLLEEIFADVLDGIEQSIQLEVQCLSDGI